MVDAVDHKVLVRKPVTFELVHREAGKSPGEMWLEAIPDQILQYWNQNNSVRVVRDCGELLLENLWPILSLSLLNSAARFALCWGLYKAVAAGKTDSFQGNSRIVLLLTLSSQFQLAMM